MPLESDAELRSVLESTRSIAVLGAKADPREDAWSVPRYLVRAGYAVVAVNPKLSRWGDAAAWPNLAALPGPVDMIDVFRAAASLPAHVDEITALAWRPRCVWLQQGIRHDACAAQLERLGIAVVQDRCAMTEHRRLCAS